MTVPILVALAVAALIGRVRGWRFTSSGSVSFRRKPLLISAFLATVTPVAVDLSPAMDQALMIVAFASVGWFLGANLRDRSGPLRAGLAVIAFGWTLNVLVISLNGAMPLSLAAYEVSGQNGHPPTGQGGFYRIEAANDSTRLRFLGDVVPIPLLRNVFSPGDLLLTAGVGVGVAGLMAPAQRKQNSLPSGSAIVTR